MNQTPMFLNIFSLLILIILDIVFFSKKRLHKIEDNLYAFLLVMESVTISIGIVLGGILTVNFANKLFIIAVLNKLYLIGLIISSSVFAYYTYCISHLYNPKNNTHKIVYFSFLTFSMVLTIILPIDVNEINGVAVTSGLALDFTSIISVLLYIVLFILLFIERKNFYNKKYIPMYILLI